MELRWQSIPNFISNFEVFLSLSFLPLSPPVFILFIFILCTFRAEHSWLLGLYTFNPMWPRAPSAQLQCVKVQQDTSEFIEGKTMVVIVDLVHQKLILILCPYVLSTYPQ